jgi:hypothetical protein
MMNLMFSLYKGFTMKRFLALLLTLILIISVVSCSPNTDTTVVTDTSTAATETETETETRIDPDIPADIDYMGATFTLNTYDYQGTVYAALYNPFAIEDA